ncbi:hypothetical protein EG328_005848 [Venturia inaequalis]|uniref:Uncharacterized protein n=1 Tax=Venturia inaequalis TaxID=5025 RepID=A0A8H3UK22_VENIN|nr:hypothetical protein EG328_005848 [Venturia inaequalis]KAE9987399.1 hypothetical protein EG327_003845 [Venturia inaequalis]
MRTQSLLLLIAASITSVSAYQYCTSYGVQASVCGIYPKRNAFCCGDEMVGDRDIYRGDCFGDHNEACGPKGQGGFIDCS